MPTDVKVPTLGESITEATVGQWLKAPGDAVALDEPIVALETDKVSVEVPSPVAGTLSEQLAKVGDTVAVGALIARIGEGSFPAQAGVQATQETEPGPSGAPQSNTLRGVPSPGNEEAALRLSPAVRRAVLENHIDPSAIRGSGKDGRLTKDDVVAAAKAKGGSAPAQADSAPAQAGASGESRLPSSPAPTAPASAGAQRVAGDRREERVKISRMRATIATRLKEAQNTAALLTTFNDVDMSAVIEARAKYKDLFEKKHGIRLGFMGFFVKAVALAAKDVPSVNASIEGDEIVYHDYLDVSVAVSAPKGLVVPVVRDADRMGFAEIEKAIAAYGKKAKDGALTAEDMKGGTFTISNGGVFGSLLSTPIINPPQSAVLGMHRIEDRPVARDGQVVIRPMMYLALSYDHRLIDGREAVTFLVRVKEAIEDPTRLLIDL